MKYIKIRKLLLVSNTTVDNDLSGIEDAPKKLQKIMTYCEPKFLFCFLGFGWYKLKYRKMADSFYTISNE